MKIRRPIAANTSLRRDPTRTVGLRAEFVRAMDRRWSGLQRDISTSIYDRDCFGIQPGTVAIAVPVDPKKFAFMRTPDKAAAFMQWLEDQEKAGILAVTRRSRAGLTDETPWSDVYIDSAYRRGILRARTEMRRRGYPFADTGIAATLAQPVHAERVAMLFTRTYEDLKTVAAVTNAEVRRRLIDGLTTELSRGMAEGKNPRVIARELIANIDGAIDTIGKVRSRLIARSEIIRAHHLATIDEYRQAAGDMQVEVMAELSTAGDDRVCDVCAALEGKRYSLDEAEGIIPVHPQCRCAMLPVEKDVAVPMRAAA